MKRRIWWYIVNDEICMKCEIQTIKNAIIEMGKLYLKEKEKNNIGGKNGKYKRIN